MKNMLRRLGSGEHCFWLLNQGFANHVVVAAEVEGVAAPKEWRAAFDELQRRHPLLRVCVSATASGVPFFQLEDKPIPLCQVNDASWTADGIAAAWLDAALTRELSEPIETGAAPLMRAVIASGTQRSVLILSCSHVVCDGIALSYCIRDLLQTLNGKRLELLRMPPSLNQLLGEAQPSLIKTSLDVVETSRRGTSVVQRLKLSRELTGHIVQRARDERTTMQGALFSALLTSGLATLPHWRYKPIEMVSPVDLRGRFGIKGECGWFTTNAKAAIEHNGEREFWDVARDVMLRLNVQGALESVRESTRNMSELLGNGLDVARAVELRQTVLQRDLTLSNLGPLRFAPTEGRFQLTGLWGPSVPTPSKNDPDNHMVGVVTVNGCAHLLLTSAAPLPSLLESAQVHLARACES